MDVWRRGVKMAKKAGPYLKNQFFNQSSTRVIRSQHWSEVCWRARTEFLPPPEWPHGSCIGVCDVRLNWRVGLRKNLRWSHWKVLENTQSCVWACLCHSTTLKQVQYHVPMWRVACLPTTRINLPTYVGHCSLDVPWQPVSRQLSTSQHSTAQHSTVPHKFSYQL